MASESYIGVDEAVSPDAKLRSISRVIGGNTVEEEAVILGEPFLPHYTVSSGGAGVGTDNAHTCQLMAGSSLNVRVRKIRIRQAGLASSAGTAELELIRLTTAGSGGSAVTPAPMDPGDAACGATYMGSPSTPGTEGTTIIRRIPMGMEAAQPTGEVAVWEWAEHPYGKPIIIPAGTSNGLCLKVVEPVTSATIAIEWEFAETAWL